MRMPGGLRVGKPILPLLAAVVLSGSLIAIDSRAVFGAPAAPPWTISRYMQNVDPNIHFRLGCALGDRTEALAGVQQDAVILHYFRPVRFADGTFGASLLNGADARTGAIGAAAREFARGYWLCTGADLDSQLKLAIGTSNDGNQVNRAHGAAWATMVNAVNVWLRDRGYSSQAQAVGASDMELGFNDPADTRAWVDGFDSVCCPILYNYGDAAGCRWDGKPAGNECGTQAFPGWTAEDVWWISWGAPPAYPLPQIYRNDAVQAKQWYGLSLYANNVHGFRMGFRGSLTQRQACNEVGCPALLDNTPAQGWKQLWDALNCVFFPRNPCPTAQGLTYSTDISWRDR